MKPLMKAFANKVRFRNTFSNGTDAWEPELIMLILAGLRQEPVTIRLPVGKKIQ